MSKAGRALPPLAVAAGALVFVAWFDGPVMWDARSEAETAFDLLRWPLIWAAGSFAVAGAVLLVATTVWKARSALASLAYVVVGGFFLLLPWISLGFARHEDGVPPVLPQPLADAVASVYLATAAGPLQALRTLAAGMVIAGIAALARSWRERAVAEGEANVPAAAAERTAQ